METATDPQTDYPMFVGGEDLAPAERRWVESVDPTSGQPWARISDASARDVDRAVDAARSAFTRGSPWRSLSASGRGRLLAAWGERIRSEAPRLAEIEVRENGKLLTEMAAQMNVVSDWLAYFGGLADKIEGRTIPLDRPDVLNYTTREPLGVIGVITPWNSPTLLTIMAVAPALAAGNTVVIKPSEVASVSLIEIARLTAEVGLPPGVVNVITGAREAGKALANHDSVAKISFTGGEVAAQQIAATVGARLGQVTLELGGKSANIIFDDADLDAAEAGSLAGIFAAGGQTCIAGSRALVHESVYPELLDRLATRARQIKLGDPTRPDTQMGPIATAAQLMKIERDVELAKQAGAQVVAGGERATVAGLKGGFFYKPTILTGVEGTAGIAQEEVFGPVLTVMSFADEEEAIELANGTRFGLAAGIWTRDVRRAHFVASELEAGIVWINMYRALAFNSPFGGFKASGHGRLNGAEAVDEFLQTKSVWVELGQDIQDPFVLRV